MRSALALGALALGCAGAPRADAPTPPVGITAPPSLSVPSFAFDSLDARPVSSDALRGRPSVLAIVTTWDLASQAQARFLVKMAEHDGDRVQYVLVAAQEPSSRELVEQYGKWLGVRFPIAMADASLLAGKGSLGDVREVPTTLILDPSGRVVFRQSGVVSASELRAHMPSP